MLTPHRPASVLVLALQVPDILPACKCHSGCLSVDISRRTHNEYLLLPLGKHTLRKLLWSGWPTCFYSEGSGIESMPKYLLFCGIFLYFPLMLSSNFFLIQHENHSTILCHTEIVVNRFRINQVLNSPVKAIPSHSSTWPKDSRRLRLPDLKTIGT